MEEKIHFYYFVFRGDINGISTTHAVALGLKENLITTSIMESAKRASKCPDNGICVGFYYMGKMTNKTFQGTPS